MSKKRLVNCSFCGKGIIRKPSEIRENNFCDRHCRRKYLNSKRVIVVCNNCGTKFEKKPSVVRNLNFCSIKCMGDYYGKSGMFSGENSGTWAGGDIEYYGPNWRIQRRKARERDNFTCQDCGITEAEYGQELSVHHIIPFRAFNGDWKRANDLSNLITLCEHPCHRKRHSKEFWLKI
ncbi:HNH endonuclease family protein [Anoxybacillus sp. B7M1]|uniref:HNH endonuclease n=3 Tax=Bacillales TaxID=1385 RepID=UPI0007B605C3|nr:HNH endonuclease family protein [Anoxybacillus sp. B2M1]ANB64694.1 HNH endonuclease family protein [Anoxybacillus sp. B7M1]